MVIFTTQIPNVTYFERLVLFKQSRHWLGGGGGMSIKFVQRSEKNFIDGSRGVGSVRPLLCS